MLERIQLINDAKSGLLGNFDLQCVGFLWIEHICGSDYIAGLGHILHLLRLEITGELIYDLAKGPGEAWLDQHQIVLHLVGMVEYQFDLVSSGGSTSVLS